MEEQVAQVVEPLVLVVEVEHQKMELVELQIIHLVVVVVEMELQH